MRSRFVHCFYAALLFIFSSIFYTTSAYAVESSSWGLGADYVGGASGVDNASDAQGLRLTLDSYVPATQWHQFQLFFQGSMAYYVSDYDVYQPNHSDQLWVFALAPVIRYHFSPESSMDPFFDISSGPGYLSTIYYENRNLGIHFTIQDMIGAGVNFGQNHQFTVATRFIHYSNAGISDHNRGLTVPILVSLSYQF